jgi:phage shock protein E
MKKYINIIIALALISVFVVGCKSIGSVYKTITPADAKKILDKSDNTILLDVRTQEEYDAEHIPNSILLPYDEIPQLAEQKLQDKNIPIIVYCRTGRRSELAAKSLLDLGYKDVSDLGGFEDWLKVWPNEKTTD